MKCKFTIVKLLLVSSFLSIGVFGSSQGISAEQLKNIKLRTGIINVDSVLSSKEKHELDRKRHREAFAETMAKLPRQSERFKSGEARESRLNQTKLQLPETLRRDEVVLLANTLGFSDSDDLNARAHKFFQLSLLIRDIYDPDNRVSQGLGILSSRSHRIHVCEIMYLATEALDHTVAIMQQVEANVQRDDAIDFHLSFAQVLMMRLRFGKSSLLHSLTDFNYDGHNFRVGATSQGLLEMLFAHLKIVEELISEEETPLPVIYHPAINKAFSTINPDQKYELIKMHKREIDQKRQEESDNPFEQLSKARGLSDGDKNPLDFFTNERIETIRRVAIEKKLDPEKLIDSTMRNHSLRKVVDAGKYFSQDVITRFLMKQGLLNRAQLAEILLQRVENLRAAARPYQK